MPEPSSASPLSRVAAASALAATTFACAPADASVSGPSPLGLWARGDGLAIVRIEPCGAGLCAINTWIKPGVSSEKTGDRLVLTVKPSGPSTWAGEAYDPQRNLNFEIKIETHAREMTTHGCLLSGWLCKDVNWTRSDSASN